ncbi:hypothetical protein ACFQHV_23700 [Promicromonospora thailandica]|uniref:Competence protein CoiA nuclease-like domain-containing protein n=1 Tax=Promicromonospora thailandica TaxID=765201 RepID=A0A9X2JUV5_9MICO|nr:hypothetical protein [Promicromonospora thailandica]MCP2264406.1 hypothetical protein [Promicromonospora thailandica]BFF20898.1 hypothetical protein GCM10025730_44190 [Promicromonospora thailandica]
MTRHPGSESEAHAELKQALREAAVLAGWSAKLEARLTDGSRADVLCESGDRRVALEAQISHQAPREYRSRVSRYAAMGIESFWFTPDKPPALETGLPVLPVENQDHAWSVVEVRDEAPSRPQTLIHPLPAVVADLLSGGLQLYSAAAPVFQLVDVMVYGCWRRECDAASVVWDLYDQLHVCLRCGLHIERSTSQELFPRKRPESDPDVVAEVAGWARSIGTAPLAPIEMTYSHTAGGSYNAFQCHACRAIIGDFYLGQAFLEMRINEEPDAPPDRRAMSSTEERQFPWHWCLAERRNHAAAAQAA